MNRIHFSSDIEPGMVLKRSELGKVVTIEVLRVGPWKHPSGRVHDGAEVQYSGQQPLWVGLSYLLGARVIA